MKHHYKNTKNDYSKKLQATRARNLLTRNIRAGHLAKKNDKRGKNLSPRNRKACHSISTALLQSTTRVY
jgi:hypothetical protein